MDTTFQNLRRKDNAILRYQSYKDIFIKIYQPFLLKKKISASRKKFQNIIKTRELCNVTQSFC